MRLLEKTTFALEKSPVAAPISAGFASQIEGPRYTDRFLSSFMVLISIFLRPIAATRRVCGRCDVSMNCSTLKGGEEKHGREVAP